MDRIYLSPRQHDVLVALDKLAPNREPATYSRSDLVAETGIAHRGTLSRYICDLKCKGCIARSKNMIRVLVRPDDERVVVGQPPKVTFAASKRKLIPYAGFDRGERVYG